MKTKLFIIIPVLVGVLLAFCYCNFFFQKDVADSGYEKEKMLPPQIEISDSQKGFVIRKDRKAVYENKNFGFSFELPKQVSLYDEKIINEHFYDADTYEVSFFEINSYPYVFSLNRRESVEPSKDVLVRVTENRFSSLSEWVSFQKEENSDYFNTRTLEKVKLGGVEAIRISDTLENKPDIEGKYQTRDFIVCYNEGRTYEVVIFTDKITSQEDIDTVFNSFRFLDSD